MAPDEMNINVVPRRGMHLPKDVNPNSRGTASENPETEELLVHTDFNALQVCDAKTLAPKRLLTYAEIDPELAGFGICAHPPKDRARGQTFNYIISKEGVLSIFALDIKAKPAKLLWKTALPCAPCYIHSLAMTDKYVVFIRNVSLPFPRCLSRILTSVSLSTWTSATLPSRYPRCSSMSQSQRPSSLFLTRRLEHSKQ